MFQKIITKPPVAVIKSKIRWYIYLLTSIFQQISFHFSRHYGDCTRLLNNRQKLFIERNFYQINWLKFLWTWNIFRENLYTFKVNNRDSRKMWNMFKVNNKGNKKTSLMSCWCLCYYLWTYFKPSFRIYYFSVDIEQIMFVGSFLLLCIKDAIHSRFWFRIYFYNKNLTRNLN